MRAIVEWSMRARILVLVMAAAIMFFGSARLREMPVDTLPEFAPPTVEIQTEALGLAASEVEQLITAPLEANLLNGVAWLETIRSESVPGLSRIELTFEQGTDPIRARQMVQERLGEAGALPHVSRPPSMLQPHSSTSRVMAVSLTSEQVSLIEMSVLARWTIRPRLMGVPGVANVAIWGQRERQLQVQVDQELLRAKGVSLAQVIRTTGNALWVSPLTFLEASSPGTGGFIETPNQRIGIQHILPIASPEDLARVPIEGSRSVRLSDVATVVEDHQPLIGDAIVNDGPGLLLVIEKFPAANALEVTEAVEDALVALEPGLPGIAIDTTVYRPATAIDSSLDTLAIASLIGLLLAVLIVGAALLDWRAAVVAGITLPVSLVAAGVVLQAAGATFNIIVLAGLVIALGVIVDDLVMDLERTMQRLRRLRVGGHEASATRLVLSSVEMREAALFGGLITLLTFAPFFFIDAPWGAFLSPLALAYSLAVLASMVTALTVAPAIGYFVFARGISKRTEPPLARWIRRSYGPALARTLAAPRALLLTVLALSGVLIVAMALWLDRPSLLPTLEDRDVLVHWEAPPGTPLPEIDRMAADLTRQLRQIPGVDNVGAHAGRAVLSDEVSDVEGVDAWVHLASSADYDVVVWAIRQALDGFPAVRREVTTYHADRIDDLDREPVSDVTVRVYGEDPAILKTKAEEVRLALSRIDGVTSARVDLQPAKPALEVEVDIEAAGQYGVKPGDVRRTATTMVSGLQVGSLFEDQKVFDVVVWSKPESRDSVEALRALQIETASQGYVTLAEVADVRLVSQDTVIKREAVSRYIDVLLTAEGRGSTAVAHDARIVVEALGFPVEYHAEVLDRNAAERDARWEVAILALAAAVIIYLLLQAAFSSWRLAALLLVSIPAALAGGIAAALALGDLSIGPIAGLLMVGGIGVRQGIVLIRHLQQASERSPTTDAAEVLHRAALDRGAPVVMSALATAAAMAPLAFVGNVFGHEIIRPMTIVTVGGLATSVTVTLFCLPALFRVVMLRVPSPESAGDVIRRAGLSVDAPDAR